MTKCAGCRVRHLDCDTQSICSECKKSGRECVRLNVRFRHLVCPSEKTSRAHCSKYDFFFDVKQTWVDIHGNVEFVVESDCGAYASPTDELEIDTLGAVGLNVEPQPALRSNTQTPAIQASVQNDDPSDYVTVSEQLPHEQPGNILLGDALEMPAHSLGEASIIGEKPPYDTRVTYTERLPPAQEPAWPLKNLQEGKLLQHFITHLAPWFEVGDSKRHFGKVAPRMATSSPLLMTVILAIAAFHQSRTSGQTDLYTAMTYHDRCLEMIVPMLSDSDPANDDCILITTTILHLYDGLESGNDLPRHLKGTSIFFPTQSTGDSSQLRRAVYWLHLRQEVYNAYLHQRSITTSLSNCNFQSENESENDDMWFHQTVYIAALVSNWAFGEEVSHSRWYELCKMVDTWESKRPASFDPIYFRTQDPQNGRYFPEVCYVTDEHVAAAHFFYLAKLLLTTHDPSIPRIGPRMKSATVAMQETALSHVRTLVGIAVCNNFTPARFTGNLAIMICNTWFTDRREQEALLNYMRDTSRCSGWTGHNAERALLEEWGWERETP